MISNIIRNKQLTAAIEGFFSSPAVGWVTSAPKNMTGCLKKGGLRKTMYICKHINKQQILNNNWAGSNHAFFLPKSSKTRKMKYVPDLRSQYRIYSTKFHVNFQTKICQCLSTCVQNIFQLKTLCCNTNECVTDTFHLS